MSTNPVTGTHGRFSAATLAIALLPVLILGVGALPARAAELQVLAPVVDVQPLGVRRTVHRNCPERPDRGAGLAAMLSWDLGVGCTTEERAVGRPTGYRVFYRWDDRVHSRVMATAPGETIPLKVRLD